MSVRTRHRRNGNNDIYRNIYTLGPSGEPKLVRACQRGQYGRIGGKMPWRRWVDRTVRQHLRQECLSLGQRHQ